MRPTLSEAMVSLLVLFAVLAIAVSFLCSLWEAVLLSITPAYARLRHQEGTAAGRQLQIFKAEIDRPLAAILTLNTIAHTVGAIGVGSQAAGLWADTNPWITQFAVPVLMTLAILVLSELIPKTLGATYWKPLVPFTVTSLRIAITLLAPFVWLSTRITRTFRHGDTSAVLTRSDFISMAEIGAQEGVFERAESQIISNLLRFDRVTARDIMTPRMVVVRAPEDEAVRAFYDANPSLPFSRIPIHERGAPEHVTGYILKDDLLAALADGRDADPLSSLRRDIVILPEDHPLPDVFSRLVGEGEHIALVADPYGGLAGIVTMEDVIETLLGFEIVDESDANADMQEFARRRWRERAKRLGIEDPLAVGPDGDPETDP